MPVRITINNPSIPLFRRIHEVYGAFKCETPTLNNTIRKLGAWHSTTEPRCGVPVSYIRYQLQCELPCIQNLHQEEKSVRIEHCPRITHFDLCKRMIEHENDVVPFAKPFDPELTSSSPALPLFVSRESLKAVLAPLLDAPATFEMNQ